MKLNCLLSLLILSASIPVLAQMPSYSPPPMQMPTHPMPMNYWYGTSAPAMSRKSTGYLITITLDTIRGTIMGKSIASKQLEVTLIDEKKQKTRYKAAQLLAMRINRTENSPLEFETKQIDGETYCLHRLVNGYAKLYAKAL